MHQNAKLKDVDSLITLMTTSMAAVLVSGPSSIFFEVKTRAAFSESPLKSFRTLSTILHTLPNANVMHWCKILDSAVISS